MIKIMLICNGKFTKKNPFNRAFLHGRKGLCMSYKEFIENLQKEIESRIGEATILFHMKQNRRFPNAAFYFLLKIFDKFFVTHTQSFPAMQKSPVEWIFLCKFTVTY